MDNFTKYLKLKVVLTP